MKVRFEVFHGRFATTWTELFQKASDFASQIGHEKLINISQVLSDDSEKIVTVWYWD